MTTKEMERKALEQIKKIVEGLGKDSYIGFAFEGCFEMAEQNIDNDWACSMKQKVEYTEKQLEQVTTRNNATMESYKNMINCLKADKEEAVRKMQEANFEAQKQANRAAKAEDEVVEYRSALNDTQDELVEAKAKLEAKEREIIELKAKLYDLMMKEGK